MAALIVALVWQVAIIAAVMTSHRGVHLAESAVFPGAGLFESDPWLAVGFAAGHRRRHRAVDGMGRGMARRRALDGVPAGHAGVGDAGAR